MRSGPAIAEPFEAHRPRLLGLAYRMLGSVASAEDVVQETWLRWSRADDVRSQGAWLTTVCTRLCLDELSSARVHREQHVGPWLPEPWVSEEPPEPGVLGRSLSMAFLLLLEELSPRERAAFLLREVFEEAYEHIAEVLQTSPETARQWVRRARAALEKDELRYEADPAAHAALLVAFGAALASGDSTELEKLLADDVIATADGGGRVHAARKPVAGRAAVARLLLGVVRKQPPETTFETAWVNGSLGTIARVDGRVVGVFCYEMRDGRVRHWRAVVDPLKLGHVDRLRYESVGGTMDSDIRVHHRAGERGAFTVDRGSDELGTLTYRREERDLVLEDTVVADDEQGHGAGGAMIRAAVAFAREAHLSVVAECPWATAYLEKHPDLLGT